MKSNIKLSDIQKNRLWTMLANMLQPEVEPLPQTLRLTPHTFDRFQAYCLNNKLTHEEFIIGALPEKK